MKKAPSTILATAGLTVGMLGFALPASAATSPGTTPNPVHTGLKTPPPILGGGGAGGQQGGGAGGTGGTGGTGGGTKTGGGFHDFTPEELATMVQRRDRLYAALAELIADAD